MTEEERDRSSDTGMDLQNYINGSFLSAASGRVLENIEPATGLAYGTLPRSDATDVERAVVAASAAFDRWSARSAEERCAVLTRIAEAIERRLPEFAAAESRDTGKPLRVALAVDIPRAVQNFRYFAAAGVQFHSQFYQADPRTWTYVLRQPCGVVGLISPWNLPLYLLTWKIAPALAAGCTVVAKPSELTSATAFLLSQVCKEVDIPEGVLNIVHGLGSEAGAAIVAHPDVSAISFTGGTVTGRIIGESAAKSFKKVSLELGGKNPTIVFDDVALEDTATEVVRAAFSNQGQICLCGSRILVQRGIYKQFLATLLERVRSLVPGDPSEEQTAYGALISSGHLEKVASYVSLARAEGGVIECGGERAPAPNERCANGFFFQPTIVSGLAPNCRVNQEEIFGPIVSVIPFENEAEAVSIANGVQYGLAASLWTKDISRAHRVAQKLESGLVWINCWMVRDLRVPFGGVKHSGLGREGGEDALRFFTEAKSVCVRTEEE